MIDLFYECEENDIANYVDDTTPYSCAAVISELQAVSTKVFNWFGNNHMKANPDKCHLLLSTKRPEVVSIDGIQIKSSTAETIDSELNFDNKMSRKINALGRIVNYMFLEKHRIVIQQSITYEISDVKIPMSSFLPYKRHLDIRVTCTEVDGWRFNVTLTIKVIFMKRAVQKLFIGFQGKHQE